MSKSKHDVGTADYPKHAKAYLEGHCGIDQAHRAGIRYVSAVECKERKLPKVNGSHHDVLYIPQHDSFSIRFIPREGERDPEPRFKRELGSTNSFYEPPLPKEYRKEYGTWDEIKQDTSILIYIVEGPIKANTLAAFGLLPIGLSGTYGWKSDGEPIKDFADWKWKGRKVILCFDSDITDKSEVRQALARLSEHLASLGAKVRVKLLKNKSNGDKVGPDDFVREHGAAEFRKLPSYSRTNRRFWDWGAPLIVQQMNAKLGFCLLNGKAVIVHVEPDPDYPGTTKTILCKASDTELQYRNQKFEVTVKKDKTVTVKQIPKFQYWMAHPLRRDIRQLILNPEQEPGYDPVTKDYNLWQGWGVVEHEPDKEHSWKRLKDHIKYVIADGNEGSYEYVLKTLAFWVQRPAEIPEAALVLLGGQGTGKGTLFWALVRIFGRHGMHLYSPRQVIGNFNAHMKDAIFIFADEALFAGDPSIVGVLHSLITEPRMVIEPKFHELYALKNMRKLGIATNEQWAVPASIDARRFAVLKVSEQVKQDEKYFGPIKHDLEHGGLQAMLYELRRMKLGSFHPRQIPKTKGLWEQKRLSFDPTTEWWFKCLLDGKLHKSDKSWRKTVECEAVQKRIADHCGDSHQRRALETKVGMTLRKLCPDISKLRAMADASDGERKQMWHYILPDLKTCRTAFERVVMQPIDWNTGEAKVGGSSVAT